MNNESSCFVFFNPSEEILHDQCLFEKGYIADWGSRTGNECSGMPRHGKRDYNQIIDNSGKPLSVSNENERMNGSITCIHKIHVLLWFVNQIRAKEGGGRRRKEEEGKINREKQFRRSVYD